MIKNLFFDNSQIDELKTWIEINKLPILMYWTQEKCGSLDIIKLIKTIKVIEPKCSFKDNWESNKITTSKDLEKYFNSIKDKIIKKPLIKFFIQESYIILIGMTHDR